MFGSQIARDLAGDVLSAEEFHESAILIRPGSVTRNQYGEAEISPSTEEEVLLASWPLSGQERLLLESGLRDKDTRMFCWRGTSNSLRYGRADGDLIVLGKLGEERNRFEGSSKSVAEAARDAYEAANPDWLASYEETDLIQLRGFGEDQYQNYNGEEWLPADVWRVVEADKWGGFTQMLGMRLDKGKQHAVA